MNENELPDKYDEFFRAVFKSKDGEAQNPFDYQRRLAMEALMASLVNVPTGAGKTNAILGAWIWRRLKNAESAGRRLIYCLPMRTLVEQTRDVAKAAVANIEGEWPRLKDRFQVHVLMGGDVSKEWDTEPERESILIGTQDMLLSRALNRGYAISRFRWPVQFGLLNNDCLWVMDEIQLMSDGLATTAQLAAFREQFNTFGSTQSIWMSATLDRNWLKQVDLTEQVERLSILELSDEDRAAEMLAKRLGAIKLLRQASLGCRMPKGLAEFAKGKHSVGTQTLIVVNTVNRAREIYDEIKKAYGIFEGKARKGSASSIEQTFESTPQIELIHSRFRAAERNRWRQLFNEQIDESSAGRIIVATQVVEAGVDISSRLLVTDLAPLSSLVQRFGRCNRSGEFDSAEIYWVDRPLMEKRSNLAQKEALDEDELSEIALPYDWQELKRAQEKLDDLQSASPNALAEVEYEEPYNPAHVLRQRDVVDLFDTTPDLSGYDLDVSRFIRAGDERDVSVAWRELKGSAPDKSEPRPVRDEICSVPIYEIKGFIKGKAAWTWDALDGKWREVTSNELRPGMILLLDSKDGGYDEQRGWDAKSKKAVSVERSEKGKANEAYDDDPLTFQPKEFLRYSQTLTAHSRETRQAAELLIENLRLPEIDEFRDELLRAAHHHDWGKAHRIFQATLHDAPKDADLESLALEPLLAKSMSNRRHARPKFRHELASALALLQTGASDLTVYLAACHHGKVRLSIRALPGEVKPEAKDARYARGIWDSDKLPEADLGNGVRTSEVSLDLEPMLLGRNEQGEPSWLERMLALRDRLGIFRLAYLECLIRAADVRASQNPQEILSEMAVEEKTQ